MDLQLVSQCDSTSNCLSRSVPEIHSHVAGTLSIQQTSKQTKKQTNKRTLVHENSTRRKQESNPGTFRSPGVTLTTGPAKRRMTREEKTPRCACLWLWGPFWTRGVKNHNRSSHDNPLFIVRCYLVWCIDMLK